MCLRDLTGNVVTCYASGVFFLMRLRGGAMDLRAGREINPKYFQPRLRDLVAKEGKLLSDYVRDKDRVLVAGCGEGRNAFRLVDEFGIHPSHFVMLDVNRKLLDSVQQNAAADQENFALFLPLLGSVYNLPLKDEKFDVVMSLGDVLSVASGGSIEDGLSGFGNVIKSGGVLIYSIVTKQYLLRVAKERGLQEKIHEIEMNGIYTDWNKQLGEGEFKCWEGREIEGKIQSLGLELLQKEKVYIDYFHIPARWLLVCRKK